MSPYFLIDKGRVLCLNMCITSARKELHRIISFIRTYGRSLRYVQSCCIFHSAFPSVAPNFPDHHFSTILQPPAYQHLSDQLVPDLLLLLVPLLSVIGFFLPCGVGLVPQFPVEVLSSPQLIR
ncbi:Uncharacterized protein HZ326_22939 [Fusarium oxysporum f. sp. albedinis]|nr:Uncharacterized protein HZ326_22939 [Fusarium oxysporum f. sp. albedinis]